MDVQLIFKSCIEKLFFRANVEKFSLKIMFTQFLSDMIKHNKIKTIKLLYRIFVLIKEFRQYYCDYFFFYYRQLLNIKVIILFITCLDLSQSVQSTKVIGNCLHVVGILEFSYKPAC